MHKDTTREFAGIAVQKIDYFKRNPLGYFISTMMAGAYVGVGIILILTLGNDADPASRNLIMGCFFGIALALIIFAGAELFSGHVMYMTFGFLYKKISVFPVIKDWVICWYGNLFGAVLLSVLFALGGGGGLMGNDSSLVHQLADANDEQQHHRIAGAGHHVQLVALSRDLDDVKNKKRHGKMHPDLLVSVCFCLGGFRAQHSEYVDFHHISAGGSPGYRYTIWSLV